LSFCLFCESSIGYLYLYAQPGCFKKVYAPYVATTMSLWSHEFLLDFFYLCCGIVRLLPVNYYLNLPIHVNTVSQTSFCSTNIIHNYFLSFYCFIIDSSFEHFYEMRIYNKLQMLFVFNKIIKNNITRIIVALLSP